MKCRILFLIGLAFSGSVMAQIPEDALRMSWYGQNGTARNQALGGAMGSLGGDITATFVNPAGLGIYKTGEIVLTPGVSLLNNKSEFRGSSASDKSNAFNFGTTGFVIGFNNRNPRWRSSAFSLAVNRTANFNSHVLYRGENDLSSYSEQYALELSNSDVRIQDALEYDAPLSLPTKMAIYSYLIDTATINGVTQVIGLPEFLDSRDQEQMIQTKGGITEIALGLAGNLNDKFYIGGSLGLPIVNYERTTRFTERDPSGETENNFNYSTLNETYTTKGLGLNAKLGIIFKPAGDIRVGLALHSPTIYGLKDTYTGDMETDTENYSGVKSVTSDVVSGNALTQFNYDLVSPWRAILSGSYIFSEVEDVTKQKGFISADIEYINHKASTFRSAETGGDDDYYEGVNSSIDAAYKGSFNVRVGGELKFNTLMTRAGFAYYGNPYTDSELKANRMFVSGGVGYRDKGFFIDLTYIHGLNKDVNFPYRLSDKPNTFAEIRGSGSNVILTGGFKF